MAAARAYAIRSYPQAHRRRLSRTADVRILGTAGRITYLRPRAAFLVMMQVALTSEEWQVRASLLVGAALAIRRTCWKQGDQRDRAGLVNTVC